MKIYIVNEKDEVIDTKERGTLSAEDIYRVTGLWITNSKGEILMAKRAATKSRDPNKWGPAVAGTIEEGETYESNIQKEAKEELGIEGVEFALGPKERVKGPHHYFCQWFLTTIDADPQDFSLQKEEVSEVRWFDPKELKDLIVSCPESFIPSMPGRIKLFDLDKF